MDGPRHTSTAARNDPTKHTTLGYAKASDLGITTDHGGQLYPQSDRHNRRAARQVHLQRRRRPGRRRRRRGHRHLGDELHRRAERRPGHDAVWTQGDWDYDGDVDGVDAGLWATAFTGELSGGGLGDVVVDYNQPAGRADPPGLGITVVPEPATVGLLGLCLAGGLARRARRDHAS